MKSLRLLGLTLFAAGGLALIGFWLYTVIGSLFGSGQVPAIIQWGVVGIILGVAVMIISLIVERVRDTKNDPDMNE